MQHRHLWAPWRIGYIQGTGENVPPPAKEGGNGCFLCDAARTDLQQPEAKQRLVLVRDERGVLLLNRYPYTNGHLLAAPHSHVADLSDLTPDQRAGLMELAELGHRLLKAAMNPQGANIGINIGRSAGAGMPGHLHMHVVPRWGGDVNFMETVGNVRVIPQALEESWKALKQAMETL